MNKTKTNTGKWKVKKNVRKEKLETFYPINLVDQILRKRESRGPVWEQDPDPSNRTLNSVKFSRKGKILHQDRLELDLCGGVVSVLSKVEAPSS